MKPICCSFEMFVSKVGIDVVSMAGAYPDHLLRADELECRVCGKRILYGFSQPIYNDGLVTVACQNPETRYIKDHTVRGAVAQAKAEEAQS